MVVAADASSCMAGGCGGGGGLPKPEHNLM